MAILSREDFCLEFRGLGGQGVRLGHKKTRLVEYTTSRVWCENLKRFCAPTPYRLPEAGYGDGGANK